jgi:pimeloyl-ACP methyl ester carboxylesterase
MRLHFQVQGAGFPLILLHGFLGSLNNWRSESKRLGDHYKVYSLDLRNHGSSPHNELMNYDVMSDDVYEFADQHNLTSSFLLGHSMGGKVAMQFATRLPDRIEKLVVVDMAPRAYEPSHRPLLNAMLALDLNRFKSFGEIDKALGAVVAEPAVRQLLLKNVARQSDGKLRWKINVQAIARNYDQLSQAITPRQKFTKPALFIRGGRSNYIQKSDMPLIREIFPRAEIETITGAGHWVHFDAPDEFSNKIIQFLGHP